MCLFPSLVISCKLMFYNFAILTTLMSSNFPKTYRQGVSEGLPFNLTLRLWQQFPWISIICLLSPHFIFYISPDSHSEETLKFEQRWETESMGQPGGPAVLLHTFVPENRAWDDKLWRLWAACLFRLKWDFFSRRGTLWVRVVVAVPFSSNFSSLWV